MIIVSMDPGRVPDVCRECGCSDATACLGADGLPCCWIEDGLCSACAGTTVTAVCMSVDPDWQGEEFGL